MERRMSDARLTWRLVLGSIIGVYVVSFFLPVFRDYPGVIVFLGGWSSLSQGYPGWLANPAFLCGTYLLARRRWLSASWVGTVALLLALSVVVWPGDVTLRSGYYVWLVSMGFLSAGSLIGLFGGWSNANQKN